jgi:hypothetical protein
VSTYLYLECLDHDPVLTAPEESGQHLYNLPQIQADIANRVALVSAVQELDLDGGDYFRRRTIWFLSQHPKCRIGIRDEYGAAYPIEGDDEEGAPPARRSLDRG